MSTPLPGQIRCPTCHRSTPPAAFCTQCGAAIPASARARPRGLDREELQDRIRVHRPGDAAFRRGTPLGEGPEQPPSPYQPFRPEPEDELVLPAAEVGEVAAHVDNTPPGFDERAPEPPPTPPVAPPRAPVFRQPPAATPPPTPRRIVPAAVPVTPPSPVPEPVVAPAAAQAAPPPAPRAEQVAEPEQPFEPSQPYDPAEPYDYRYRPPDDEWGRRGSGMSPLAIGGFVLLGVLAIGVGAFIAGIFGGGVAVESPTSSPIVSVAPSEALEPSAAPSSGASLPVPTPGPSSGSVVTFPDGFTARTEPCAEEPSTDKGCNSSGSTVSGGSVWVWVGFRKGNNSDVLSVSILDAAGTSVGDGSLALGSLGCGDSCNGWGRFRFNGLAVGNYTIEVRRNGELAAEASFTVTG
jgi:hypothetical protein